MAEYVDVAQDIYAAQKVPEEDKEEETDEGIKDIFNMPDSTRNLQT